MEILKKLFSRLMGGATRGAIATHAASDGYRNKLERVYKTVIGKRHFFPMKADTAVYEIDWRALERNKYAPWGRGQFGGK